jgi:predicted kinase
MTMLRITRGLPASGKTTLARAWVAEDPRSRARVNRDDLRAMLHTRYLGQDTERQIQAFRDAAVVALLERGIDVIIDDTCLPARTVRDLRRLSVRAGATFEVVDLTDVPLETCLERNAARPETTRVAETWIRDMYQRYIAGRPYPLPLAAEPADVVVTGPYEAPADAPRAIMVDVDGTVALMADRSPYDETRVHLDQPNRPVIAAVQAMAAAGCLIVFCSGRTEAARAATEKWLREQVAVPYEALFLRRSGDVRKDSAVKLDIFDREIRHRFHIVAVFDDRDQVVRMWRELGLTVFQVAPGAF